MVLGVVRPAWYLGHKVEFMWCKPIAAALRRRTIVWIYDFGVNLPNVYIASVFRAQSSSSCAEKQNLQCSVEHLSYYKYGGICTGLPVMTRCVIHR